MLLYNKKYVKTPTSDICGLDDNRLTLTEKMEQIIEHSVLQNAFKEAGIK